MITTQQSRAIFIVLEGIDGAGTTTQAHRLAEWFAARSIPAHLTAEPSSGRVGRLIREYLSGAVAPPDPLRHFHQLALLFAADRLDHLAREIEPHLAQGIHVISDRYLLSSLVYQSLHCDPLWVRSLNAQAPAPDLTFLLDLPAELAMDRLARRSLFTPAEIYETLDQQQRLRSLYLQAAPDPSSDHPIILIDASLPPDQVHDLIVAHLKTRLT